MIGLKATVERPLINTKFYPYGGSSRPNAAYIATPRDYSIKELMWWIKRTPECIGIGKRIVTDIFTDYYFTAIDKPLTGRPAKTAKKDKEDKANIFARQVNLKPTLHAVGLDWIFTGDGYIWYNLVSDNKIKEISNKYCKSYGIEIKAYDPELFKDEDYDSLKSLQILPSTTTEIRHNGYKILFYRQTVGMTIRDFRPDEVVHTKFLDVDGDAYGFTPMRAASNSIMTLGWIKDYATNFFKNGGVPNKIFIMPKEMANSPNAKAFEQVLQKYKELKHQQGNMMAFGDLKVENLNEFNKDMEFRQLAIYLTGVLAFAFNMPADILSSILGVDIKGTAGGSDIEDSGYKDNVANSQEYWENILNTQIFNPFFDVDIHFERKFRQDQIRVTQHRVQNVALLEFLFKHDYPITDEFVHDVLQIPREYLTDGKIKREVEEMMGGGLSSFTPPAKGPNQEKLSNQKKAQQKPQANNNPPTGV